MNWERYKTEIELIEKQNDVEHDLYNVIADMMKERQAFANVSLRDISCRKRTKCAKEKVFWGLKGFPVFAILDKEYEPIKQSVDRQYLYGIIEVKFVSKPLCKGKGDIKQLWGHLLWFKKVIYTNGIVWNFYRISDNAIREIVNKTTKKELTCLQTESYLNLAKKGITYQEIDDVLDFICENYSVANLLEHKPFVLRAKSDSGTEIWNREEWENLVRYLDEYDYV